MMSTALAESPNTMLVGGTVLNGSAVGVQVGLRHQPRPQEGRAVWFGGDLAVAVDPRDRRSATVAAAAGLKWTRPSGFGLALEGGLAFSVDHETLGTSLSIGTGEQTVNRAFRPWLVPRLTARVSMREQRPIGLFSGVTVGHEIGFSRNGATVVQLDAGITVRFGGAQ